MKILTTALFSVFLLHKKLSLRQWIALIIIVPGVGLVELSSKVCSLKWFSREEPRTTFGFRVSNYALLHAFSVASMLERRIWPAFVKKVSSLDIMSIHG